MKMRRFLGVLLIVLSLGLVWNTTDKVYAEDINPELYGSTYAYDALSGRDNGADRQKLYNDIADSARTFWNNTEDLTEITKYGDYVFDRVDISGYSLTPDDIVETYFSFKNDNPIYYFLSSTCSYDGHRLIMSTDSEYQSGNIRESYNNIIISQVESLAYNANNCQNNYEKIAKIHDNINEILTYGNDADGNPIQDAYAHNIIGAFVKGTGVCESYARTFQLMMNYLNIDNVFVTGTSSGENHAWNMVKLDDGKYYYVDCTWDDTNKSDKYLVKGSYVFDQDHKINTPDAIGIHYLYKLPQASDDDYIKTFTLKKGNTVIGHFANPSMAFEKMTDPAGVYVIDIEDGKTLLMPAGKWPEVKEICFDGGEGYGNYYDVDLAGNVTVRSDIRLKGIALNSATSYLISNKKNALMNIGNHTLTVDDYSVFGGYSIFLEGYTSNGTGPCIKGTAGSVISVNQSLDVRTDYINVDTIKIGSADLSANGTNIIANEVDFNGNSAVRLYGNKSDKFRYTVKNTVVGSKPDNGDSAVMFVSDMSSGSIISNGKISGKGYNLYKIIIICGDGKYPKVSVSDSTVPLSIGLMNYTVNYFGNPEDGDAKYEIWKGMKSYKGSIINIGKTPIEKIDSIHYQTGSVDNRGNLTQKASVNICALFAKDSKGNLFRKYDENYWAKNGILHGYHSLDSIKTTKFVIPSTVKKIADYAFWTCETAQSVVIPTSVNTIGSSVFCGSKVLKEILVPPTVKNIGAYAFGYYLVDGTMYPIKGFKVICVKGSAAYNYAVGNGLSYKFIPQNVVNAKIDSRTYNSLTLKWSKVYKATGYLVKQYKNGKWVTIKNTKGTSVKITGLAASSSYKLQVIAYIKDGNTYRYSYKAASLTGVTVPKPVAKLKAVRRGRTAIRLGWAKNTTAGGYIVDIKKGRKWTRVSTINRNSTVNCNVTGLKKGTVYSLRVRSYKKIGTKTYYSTYRNVNIKL